MTTYGVPTGGVPRREDEATTRAREDALRERIRQENIASSEYIRNGYMEAKEREDDRIESEAFAAIEPKADAIQVGGHHYKDMGMQPWDVMEAVLTHTEFVGFLKGNIIKYSMRQGKKQDSDDAGKARHYKQKLTELESKQ